MCMWLLPTVYIFVLHVPTPQYMDPPPPPFLVPLTSEHVIVLQSTIAVMLACVVDIRSPVQRRFEEYVLGLLNVSLPGSKEKTAQAVTGKTPQAVTGKTPQVVTEKSLPKDELSSKGGDDNEAASPGNASSDDPLAAALRAKRGELKPTEVSDNLGTRLVIS